MKAPAWMFRQEVEVTPYEGESAYGPVYGASYTLKCRIEASRRVVMTREGEEVVAMARLFCRPGANLPSQSEIVWDGRDYDVVNVATQPGANGKPHHIEADLA